MSRSGRSLARLRGSPSALHAALLATLCACAPSAGWRRDDARACAPGSPPIVCLQAEPDRPVELRFSGVSLLPGECARAPEKAHGGSLSAELVSREGERERVRIGVRKNRITFVTVDDRGTPKVTERQACDRTIAEPLANPAG